MMMMKWFLLLTALLPITPSWTEVVDSVSKCPGFLLEESPPQIPTILVNGNIQDQNRYKLICQTFINKPRYLTLYDTNNKIPVFSAYKFQEKKDKGRPTKEPWKIEPQLSGGKDNNMMKSKAVRCGEQASDQDYKKKAAEKGCDRGHLYPSCHAPETDDKKSTFTLTNIVPQVKKFNSGSWNRMEGHIKCVMEKFCINQNGATEAFVVVGAKPSEGEEPNKVNEKVNIPDMLWSAFCCYSSKVKRWVAAAHWAPNTVESAGVNLQTKTVKQLNAELSKWKEGFNVFPGEGKCLEATIPESKWNIVRNWLNCAWKGVAACTQSCRNMLVICANNAMQCIRKTATACARWCRC